MKNTKRTPVKILSLFLIVLITLGMVPTSVLASDADLSYSWETGTETTIAAENSEPTITVADSSSPNSHEEDESPETEKIPLGSSGAKGEILPWANNLHQMVQKPSTFSVNGISTSSIMWGGGNIEFGGGTYYVGSGYIYRITHSGGDAFCAEFNGNMAGGNYIQQGEGTNSAIKQVIANYEASGKTDSDYITAQVKIWSILLGQSITSWGGSNPNMSIINGTSDTSGIKYFNHKNTNTPHTQNIITYTNDLQTEPEVPEIPELPSGSTITIYKRDSRTNQLLAGAVFEVRDISGGSYGTYTTNSSGVATLNLDIPPTGLGLVITEISPPAGYYLSENNVQDVFIAYKQASASVTFVNDPAESGELVIYKLDAKTGRVLEGAVFEVRNGAGGVLGTITTDNSGKATVPIHDIPREGITLIVEEISPPPNYYLSDDNVKDVHIPYGATSASVTFVNDPILKSELRILKISETGTPVPNTEFEVRSRDSAISTTVTTGADGVAVLTDIEPTWYTVTEKSVPEPYILDTTPQVIELVEGETHRLTFKNKSKSEVIISKTDVKNRPLAGAIFEVKYKDDGTIIGEFTTDSNGKIVLTGVLPETWITITEKSAPHGYVLRTETKEIQVASDSKTEVQFVNNEKPKLQLKKVDEQDNSTVLKDAIFKLSYKNGGTIGTFTTDSNGIIFLEELEPDQWVVIEEIQAPECYLENGEVFEVFLEVDKTAEIIITNKRKPTIELEKRDSISKQSLQFAQFIFERLDENTNSWVEVGTYTTDENGMIVVENLDYVGRYRYTETKSPDGYHEDTDPVEFIVEWGKKVELVRENTPKHPLIIKKIDSVTGRPLAGVHFRVTKANGEFVADGVTGRNGYIIIPELDAGFYQAFETKTLPNYILDETIQIVEIKYGEPCIVEFENKPLGSFLIKKISASTDKEPLAGAEFKLTNKNGQYIGTYTTDVNGECLITNLEPNWYTLVETASVDGFILDSTPLDFEITWGGILTRTFVNKPETGIHILKKNKLTGEPMAGISFRITQITGEYVGDYKTDSAGRIYSGKLDAGFFYVQETETLPNFNLDSVPRLVEIKSGEHSSVLYENIEYPTLILKKTDKDDGKPLAGVKFRLYDEQMREIGTYTTNDLGMIVLKGVDGITEGKYFLQEIQAKDGYVLDEAIHEIRLFYGKTTTINVKNTRNATLRLKKVDRETGDPLYNVEFILMDSKNNVIGVYTTNQNGEIIFPAELKAGKYKLRENKTLPEYVLDDVVRDVILGEGETTEIVWKNQRKEGRIQITKVSSGNNEITKDRESKGLSQVKFEIYNSKMELVDTVTTDNKGLATSKYLPLGIYGIKEISPADYYFTDGEMFYAELKIHDDLVKFTVKNDPVTIKTNVEKRGNTEVQSGDSMYYEFSEIRNDSNVPLEEFYLHDILPTDGVRLEKIWTGTWSERSKMEVQIKTNKKPNYRTIKTGLLSDNNNEIDCSPSTLGLAGGEYVTEFKIVFKQEVGVGFHNTSNPKIQVKVMDMVQKDQVKLCYQFTNKVDVGGRYIQEWTYSTDGWTTTVWCKKKGDLPKTGLSIHGFVTAAANKTIGRDTH